MTKPLDELPGEFNAYCESLGLEEPESIAVLYDALKLYYERGRADGRAEAIAKIAESPKAPFHAHYDGMACLQWGICQKRHIYPMPVFSVVAQA